ncbi:MAG: tRNA preQ1(34) S-adenosylmethionine ribosyltransferase-isomerase QueA [Oscillospiraceae bacterium]|nr:tRNA preQ1(34) S-adenosylmethionine ribosyltransferase-isomerase QueA [Oscillospiraceae bacterium]
MEKSLFYYDLPNEFIAQTPIEPRDSSKLLVTDIKKNKIYHKKFYNIIDYLEPGDLLVLNNSKVLPARLIGQKKETGAKIEFLLVKQDKYNNNLWEVLIKPAKRLKINSEVSFGDGKLTAVLKNILNNGNRLVEFKFKNNFFDIINKIGQMPLPHYITNKLENKDRYQTVFSKEIGSIAAPTAGLHFTEDLLLKIKNKGVNIKYITLHVGIGTFRPVSVDDLTKHKMHSEYYFISDDTAKAINQTKKNKNKVVAVGTTTCRVLETVANLNKDQEIKESSGSTDIFIYPPYKFKVIDALVTNFHLPESTLIMLVSALAGREFVLEAYEEAKKNNYRFFSFGDAMLLI